MNTKLLELSDKIAQIAYELEVFGIESTKIAAKNADDLYIPSPDCLHVFRLAKSKKSFEYTDSPDWLMEIHDDLNDEELQLIESQKWLPATKEQINPRLLTELNSCYHTKIKMASTHAVSLTSTLDDYKTLVASMSRHCAIYKTKDGSWYMELASDEYGESEEADLYGPFASEEDAYKYLDHFSNPGSVNVNNSGKREVPKKAPNGDAIIRPKHR